MKNHQTVNINFRGFLYYSVRHLEATCAGEKNRLRIGRTQEKEETDGEEAPALDEGGEKHTKWWRQWRRHKFSMPILTGVRLQLNS